MIRFKKYKNKAGEEIKALKITEKNVQELVDYINKNGGTALNETQIFKSEHLKDGEYAAVKIANVQRTPSATRVRRDVRKAYANDFIVRDEVPGKDGYLHYEFSRVRAADFSEYAAV